MVFKFARIPGFHGVLSSHYGGAAAGNHVRALRGGELQILPLWTMLKGEPLWSGTIPPACHPPRTCFETPLRFLPQGKSHT